MLETSIRSDAGWGCMLRTGQMILMEALKRHVFKQEFSLEMLKEPEAKEKYYSILQMFMDNPPVDDVDVCPFGIQNIAREAQESLNIRPGQWFGPQMISVVLGNLCNRIRPVDNFEVHVSLDGNIFLDKIKTQLVDAKASLLVLVPIRLGLDSIQAAYLNQLKAVFKFTQNVGIAGGRDQEAFYLVGLDNADLEDEANPASYYYLDPHVVQRAVPGDWTA